MNIADADRALAAQLRETPTERIAQIIALCTAVIRERGHETHVLTDADFPTGERVGG